MVMQVLYQEVEDWVSEHKDVHGPQIAICILLKGEIIRNDN